MVSVHTAAPVAQETWPVLHGLGLVVQAALAVQLTQPPLPLHTRLVPQAVPALSFAVSSTQTGLPVLQETVPSLHWLGFVVQAVPAAQATQTPALQN